MLKYSDFITVTAIDDKKGEFPITLNIESISFLFPSDNGGLMVTLVNGKWFEIKEDHETLMYKLKGILD